MKKRGLILGALIFLLILFPIVSAENNTTAGDNSLSEQSKITKAYNCLESKIGEDCSTSLEDNIFALLATGKCKKEILDNSWEDNECWPKSDCNIKTTAQAVLALNNIKVSTANAEDWLLSQNATPKDIVWYLEIESPKPTKCTVSYSGAAYQISIGNDKKISSSAGNCLSLSQGDWWLRVSPSCYDKEFKISCDEQFLTTFLFKKKTSTTIHVSDKISSASAEGTTKGKVNFKCFSTTGSCDYEGSLWAALVLNHVGYDVSPYMPYLTAMADENKKFIPDSFLYLLTGSSDFRTDLLLKQKNKYWDESGDKFYDTAIALYPFQYENPDEKTNSKTWLLDIQGEDGCWDGGNIRNNAFILYSIWPKNLKKENAPDCEDSGYYCMSEIDCTGKILSSYNCAGVLKCCDTKKPLEDCSTQGGTICNSDKVCSGTTVESSDVEYGEICCVKGKCEEQKTSDLSCEQYNGICRPSNCKESEEESSSYSCDYGDICCMKKTSQSKSYWWVWLLSTLIILTVVAIIFRNKLRPYYQRITSRFRKGPKSTRAGGPKYPPSGGSIRRMIPRRRIIPPTKQYPQRRPIAKRPQGEIDEVLKKLKEMGK